MRYDPKYKMIAYGVIAELQAAYGTQYVEPFLGDDMAIASLGWAIQRATQKEQLKEICQDLELDLPEETKKGKRTISQETREKLRTAQLGRQVSEETRQKISAAQKGRKLSEETKQRIRESRKAHNWRKWGKVAQASLEQEKREDK